MSLLQNHKQAQVSIQINWIFVLIVGGIILIFFMGIVIKQKNVSNVKHNIDVSESLDTIFVSSQVAVGTSSLVNIPRTNIEFDCNNYFVGEFDTGISKELGRSRVIFVPNKISTRQLLTWSLEWNLPFKVMDFLYLTAANIRYIFVHDNSDFAKEIFEMMPNEMQKELVEISNFNGIRAKNNFKTKFIFFDIDNLKSLEVDEKFNDISAINIQSRNKDTGTITFFKYKGGFRCQNTILGTLACDETRSKVPYFDFNPSFTTKKYYPSLAGAIFAEDLDTYSCMFSKAFTRYSHITQVYLDKIENIVQNPSEKMIERGCTAGLFGFRPPANKRGYGTLKSLLKSSNSCADNLNNPGCNFNLISELVEANKIIQTESCPLIY